MTDRSDYVAVLRNLACGHILGIAHPDRVKGLYRRLIEINRGGWCVRIERNEPSLIDDLMGGPCPKCRIN